MKNIAISLLSAFIITGMDFWRFRSVTDRLWSVLAITLILFFVIVAVEDWLRDRRMKRFRSERFWRMVKENRP